MVFERLLGQPGQVIDVDGNAETNDMNNRHCFYLLTGPIKHLSVSHDLLIGPLSQSRPVNTFHYYRCML